MNKSGQAVGVIAGFYKIKPDEILVVHDELGLLVGQVRMKFGGGHAGHNGLRDIIARIGSADFYRLRIGIGRPQVGSVADYVLSKPSLEEQQDMDCLSESVLAEVNSLLMADIAVFNQRLS
jgi:PTH1 family peptidyl-tRNA hydrolase